MGEWVSKLWEAIKKVASTPTMVQASPGVATSYSTTGQYMPRVKSTIGNEAGYLLDAVTAPTQPSDIKAAYQVARHPVQSARAVKKATKETLQELRSYYLFPRKKQFELQAFTPQYDPFGIFKDNGELNYHMQRLINGGLDKLKQQGQAAHEVKVFDIDESLSNFDNIYQLAISRSPGMEGKEIYDALRQGIQRIANNNVAVSIGDHNGNALGIIVKAKKIPNSGNTVSHELDHALHRPITPPEGFDFSGSLYKDYFLNKNGTELSARGTQVKDYFRITDPNEPITEDMLKTASQVYIKDTGINNMMSEFFKGISDYKKAAKWLSDNSTVISVPFLLSPSIIGPQGDAGIYQDRFNQFQNTRKGEQSR